MTIFATLRTYLLVILTMGFALGIALSLLNPFFSIAAAVLVFFLTVICSVRAEKKDRVVTLLFIFFLTAGLLAGTRDAVAPAAKEHIFNHAAAEKSSFVVIGTVKRIFSFDGLVTRFDVKALSSRQPQNRFRSTTGIIRYTLTGRLPAEISPGSMVVIRAKLRHPNRFATPGSFDYPSYLASKNIFVTGYISSRLHIAPVQEPQSIFQRFANLPENVRHGISLFLDGHLPESQAAVYKALLTGDRSALSDDVIDDFKASGTLHILAISGLHMSLLAVFLFTVLFWLLRRSEYVILRLDTKKCAAALSIIPLLFYTLIAGAQIPVIRSFLMSLIAILAICYGKRHHLLTLISCAALLILAYSPRNLFLPSFQLTFAAVLAITAAIPLLEKMADAIVDCYGDTRLARIFIWLTACIGVSMAATIGTAPILVYHFNRLSLVGVFANLVIEPLLCLWTLCLGFIAVPFMWLAPPLAELLLPAGGRGILLALKAAGWFADLPHASLFLPSPTPLHIALYYLSFLPLLLWRQFGVGRISILCILPTLAIFFLFLPPAELLKPLRKETEMSFLDVGHGSCTFIQMPGGRRVLIDGGAISVPGFDIGSRVLVPFLFRKGISSLDEVIVTHPDSDHYNGLVSVLERLEVENLWISRKEHDSAGWRRLLETARRHGVNVIVPEEKTVIAGHADSLLEVLVNTCTYGAEASNDQALVLRYTHGEEKILFPGDLSEKLERKLVADHLDIAADVLLAVHHGSAGSNSEAFLAGVAPDLMIVSSGKSGSSSHPARTVVERCAKHEIAVLPINQSGTVTLTLHGTDRSVTTFFPCDAPVYGRQDTDCIIRR